MKSTTESYNSLKKAEVLSSVTVINQERSVLLLLPMAYIPPHMRKGNNVESPIDEMLIPSFRKNLKLGSYGRKQQAMDRNGWKQQGMDRSGKIVYADTAIARWFAVGLNGNVDFPTSPVHLQRFPWELVKRISGKEPLALVNTGIGLFHDDQVISQDSTEKPWSYIAVKVLQDLINSSEFVRRETEVEDHNSKEIKPKLVARVGKVLFLPRRLSTFEEYPSRDSGCEESLRQLNRCFYTNVPSSYMEGIVEDVVPKIGVEFEDLKDVYHVKLSDKSRPESTISCKCRFVKEEARVELYKVELNQVRHMVYDISSIDKNLDLRLMLSTKRTLTSLSDDEMESIGNLVGSAIVDPDSKGGLRWPFGKATSSSSSSSSDRFRVIGVWHTVSRAYESRSMRLKVRDADRFDFRTSYGEVTREVTLKLKGLASALLGKKPERESVFEMLEESVKQLWEHFLPSPTQEM